MKSFLLFYTKSVCYNSMYAFINSMVRTLRSMGHKCETCTALRPQDLIQYFGRHFDGILDIDSTLPNLVMEDGSYYLDHIDAPFYNYLLDHPVYYSTSLKSGMKRQNVLCIDEDHAEYVRKHYKNIESATFLPLGMMEYDEKRILEIPDRKTGILFTGTYTSEGMLHNRLEQKSKVIRQDTMEIMNIMTQNTSMGLEDAVREYFSRKPDGMPEEEMSELCSRYSLADFGASAVVRAKVMRTLLKHKVPVTVCGHGWNMLNCPGEEFLAIIPEKTYVEAVELAYNTKILLNVMPGFKAGIHDRIPTAMGHGAVSCSDGTRYLEKLLNSEEYLPYDISDLYELSEMLSDKIEDISTLEKMAMNGHRKADEVFTWRTRMEEWISAIAAIEGSKEV